MTIKFYNMSKNGSNQEFSFKIERFSASIWFSQKLRIYFRKIQFLQASGDELGQWMSSISSF